MQKNLRINKENLIITIPRFNTRSNPYDEDEHCQMNNIIGLYEKEYENGLVYAIDMSYCGKADQCSDYFYKLNGTKEEFDAMCKELEIDTEYLAQCDYCHKSIYGSFTLGDKGNMCNDCEYKKKKT